MKAQDITPGMKIKFALPTKWCQVKDKCSYIWFKGKVVDQYEKAIVVSGKNRKHRIYLDRIMCFAKNGEYLHVKKQKTNI